MSSPVVRRVPLLVLAVLVGLVGMHGLAAVAGVPVDGPSPVRHHAVAFSGVDGCAHHGTPGGGRHSDHVDAPCKASAPGTGTVVPAVQAGAVVAAAGYGAAPQLLPAAAVGSRDPPSLSELQLLRI